MRGCLGVPRNLLTIGYFKNHGVSRTLLRDDEGAKKLPQETCVRKRIKKKAPV